MDITHIVASVAPVDPNVMEINIPLVAFASPTEAHDLLASLGINRARNAYEDRSSLLAKAGLVDPAEGAYRLVEVEGQRWNLDEALSSPATWIDQPGVNVSESMAKEWREDVEYQTVTKIRAALFVGGFLNTEDMHITSLHVVTTPLGQPVIPFPV